jgi:hypothetical protein
MTRKPLLVRCFEFIRIAYNPFCGQRVHFGFPASIRIISERRAFQVSSRASVNIKNQPCFGPAGRSPKAQFSVDLWYLNSTESRY